MKTASMVWTAWICGAAGVAAYLLTDSISRSQKYFEYLQGMVTKKLNHESGLSSEAITNNNITDLLTLHKRALNKAYKPAFDSPQWRNDVKLAEEVTDLLNRTYNQSPRTANFTIGKFDYLLGFGLLVTFPESLALWSFANRSRDMRAVNAAAQGHCKRRKPRSGFWAIWHREGG